MKKIVLLITLNFTGVLLFAQKKTTTSAIIKFDATTSLDAKPKAENKTVVAAIDLKTGALAFEAIVKSFSFANPMMQDHFNSSNWLDSDKFPTATFKGKIINFSAVNFNKDGTYQAEVTGNLTIHGITKAVKTTGSVTVTGKQINEVAAFTIKVDDYEIKNAAIEAGKVAREPKIIVSAEFK